MYTNVPHHLSLRTGIPPLEGHQHNIQATKQAQLFELCGLSFGAAETYARSGGQPVYSDESPAVAPVDIAVTGLDVPRDLGRGGRALGAFVIGDRKLRIRVRLSAVDGATRFAFVRASTDDGQQRVRETAVAFEDGFAEIDLPLTGVCTNRVGIVNENWIWECRAEGAEFATIECDYAGHLFNAFPIRLYFTAGSSCSICPRESFYHVACVNSRATDLVAAERAVWKNFSSFREGQLLTNARGQRLGFWRENKPGALQTDFIDREAQELITKTDSSCRGWAELFREALAVHGISAVVRAVRPRLSAVHPHLGLPTFLVPDGRGGKTVARTVGILVKPFKWKAPGQLAPFPFQADECETVAGKFLWKLDNPIDPYTASWPQTDTHDLLRGAHTAPGTEENVRGIFGNHAVVLIKRDNRETWYDPSFGFGPYDSLLDYENDLLGRGEENHGGLFAIVGWKREHRPNPQTGQIEEHNAGLLLGAAPPPKHAILEACEPG